MDSTLLLWNIIFSSVGLGFFVYGKKERAPVPLFCGVALMAYPYIVGSVLMMIVIGVILSVIPYFIRR